MREYIYMSLSLFYLQAEQRPRRLNTKWIGIESKDVQ